MARGKACKFRTAGCTLKAPDAWIDYCLVRMPAAIFALPSVRMSPASKLTYVLDRCRICKQGVRDVSDKYCSAGTC